MKKVLAGSALVLIAGLLTSCGGPPTDASKSEFCGVFQSFLDDAANMDPDDVTAAGTALKRTGDKLKDVGTPSNIPDDARAGFEKIIEVIDNLPDKPSKDDLDNLDKDLSSSEKADSQAFNEYLNDECGDIAPSAG